MKLNVNIGNSAQVYGLDCAENAYVYFNELTGNLISGNSLNNILTGVYDLFTGVGLSNSTTNYAGLTYGKHNSVTLTNATVSPNNFFNHTIYTGKNFFEIYIPPTSISTGIFISGNLPTFSAIFSPCINNKIPLFIKYSGTNGNDNNLNFQIFNNNLNTTIIPNSLFKYELSENFNYNIYLSGWTGTSLLNGIRLTISNPGILPIDYLTGRSNSNFTYTPSSKYDTSCYKTGYATGSGISYVNKSKAYCDGLSSSINLQSSGQQNLNCSSCNYTVSFNINCPQASYNNSLSINGFASGNNFPQVLSNAINLLSLNSCDNCYYLLTGDFYTGDQSLNRYDQYLEYCNVTGSGTYQYGNIENGLNNLKYNLLNNVNSKALYKKCLIDTSPERQYNKDYLFKIDLMEISACGYCGLDFNLELLNKTDSNFATAALLFGGSPISYRLVPKFGISVNNSNQIFVITTGEETTQTVIWFSPFSIATGPVGSQANYQYFQMTSSFKTLLSNSVGGLDAFTGNYVGYGDVIPATNTNFFNRYGDPVNGVPNWKTFAGTKWDGVVPPNTPLRFFVLNTYTDGIINNNGFLSTAELLNNEISQTFVHNSFGSCEGCNYRYDEYTGYGFGTGLTFDSASGEAQANLDLDINTYRSFNPCPYQGLDISSFIASNSSLAPEWDGYYLNTTYYGGAGNPPFRTNYIGTTTGWCLLYFNAYAAPNRFLFRRNDTNALIYDTLCVGEVRNNPPAGVDLVIDPPNHSLGLYCFYKNSSYDTIKTEMIKMEATSSAGFWEYKIIGPGQDLLTNIFIESVTSSSCTGIPNQSWTTNTNANGIPHNNWIVPIIFNRKIRVKFVPNPPGATELEADRLKMVNLLVGGSESTLLDTGPTLATYNQDINIPSNATGVRIEITTDTSNINVEWYKWNFGIKPSGINPF